MGKARMSQDEQEAEQAVRHFYDAIETMVSGGGSEAINETWHHTDRVTSRHPVDKWSVGWDEVWETWKFTATFGRKDRGGSKLLSLNTYVYDDLAYATVVFQASPAWGGEEINCTNVLAKIDGLWKIVHHHADASPKMELALQAMLAE
jgi:ketosteroid isomerase-like protein